MVPPYYPCPCPGIGLYMALIYGRGLSVVWPKTGPAYPNTHRWVPYPRPVVGLSAVCWLRYMTLIISISMLSYPLVLAFPRLCYLLFSVISDPPILHEKPFIRRPLGRITVSSIEHPLALTKTPKTNPKSELPKAPLQSVADCRTSSVAAKSCPVLLTTNRRSAAQACSSTIPLTLTGRLGNPQHNFKVPPRYSLKAQCGQLAASKRESWDCIARPLLVLSLTFYHSLFLVLSGNSGLAPSP